MKKVRWLVAFGCLVSSAVLKIGSGFMMTMIRQQSYKEQLTADYPVNQVVSLIDTTSSLMVIIILVLGILIMAPDIIGSIQSKIKKSKGEEK